MQNIFPIPLELLAGKRSFILYSGLARGRVHSESKSFLVPSENLKTGEMYSVGAGVEERLLFFEILMRLEWMRRATWRDDPDDQKLVVLSLSARWATTRCLQHRAGRRCWRQR